ncbi:MAG: 30S ribosomal protein S17 [Patescibacteria group bacterium]
MSKKRFKGVVVSDKMQKTVVVLVDVPKTHPIYKKSIKNSIRLKAHNEKGAKMGDLVVIEESRPISKSKNFIVVEVAK